VIGNWFVNKVFRLLGPLALLGISNARVTNVVEYIEALLMCERCARLASVSPSKSARGTCFTRQTLASADEPYTKLTSRGTLSELLWPGRHADGLLTVLKALVPLVERACHES
jgi:hypothetical protein